MERDLDRLISALLERRDSGALRPDVRGSRFGHWASSLDIETLRATAHDFAEGVQNAAGRSERLKQARRLLGDMKTPAPALDPAPALATAFLAAEEEVGLSLPQAVRRIYCEVADGGFGPGEGLLPVASVASETLKARSETAEAGVTWPANLIIIQPPAPITHCLDCGTGEVIAWDGEAFCELVWAEAPARDVESAFFEGLRVAAPSLEDWLGRWLDGPSAEEVAAFEAMKDKAFAEARENWRQRVEAYIEQLREQSLEERAKLGLKGDDWEAQLRRDLLGR